MIEKYQKPAELYDGLRLHQNENTGGCSPQVLAALASLRPEQVGFYPPYDAATRACARYLDVDPDRLSLLNGLDEGIMATSVAYLSPRPGHGVPEAIIPEPAFEIFAFDAEVVGGRPVRVEPNPDYSFPLVRVLDEITPNTRVVFITSPNNPTGVLTPAEASTRLFERGKVAAAESALTRTVVPSTRIRTEGPASVFAERRPTTFAAGTEPLTTW